jgi:hypothetical protein
MKTAAGLLALMLTLVGLASVASAAPPRTHAVVQIKNESVWNAIVYYRWSDSSTWQDKLIRNGENMTISRPYPANSKKSPTLYVRFNAVTEQKARIVEYTVARGAASSTAAGFGTKYVINEKSGSKTVRFLAAASPKAEAKLTNSNAPRP